MPPSETKGIQDEDWLGGNGDPLENMLEIKIWSYLQIVHAQTRICYGKWDVYNSQGVWNTNG